MVLLHLRQEPSAGAMRSLAAVLDRLARTLEAGAAMRIGALFGAQVPL